MRSRDGNSYRSFAVRSVIFFFFSFAALADEYLISYRYVVKDATLYNESLQISRAMKPCKGEEEEPLELFTDKADNFRKIIDKNSQEFIDYLHKLGLSLEHTSKTSNNHHSSTTIHTLRTQCFKVQFNDNFVRITPLK